MLLAKKLYAIYESMVNFFVGRVLIKFRIFIP